ncbi:hypothetical protein MMPV_003754 [Pyropia vietnamensis]
MPQSRKRTAEGEPGSPPPAIVGGTTATARTAGTEGAAGVAATTAAAAPSPSPVDAGEGGVVAATTTPALRPRRRLLRVPKLDIGVSPPAPGVSGATEATVTVHRAGAGVPGGRTRTVLEGARREDILQCAVVAGLVAKAEGRPPPPAAAVDGVGGTPPAAPPPRSTGTATVGVGATTTATAAGVRAAASPPRAVLVRLPLASHAAFDAFLEALADTRAAAAADAEVDADTTVGGGSAAAATDGSADAARPVTPLRTPSGGGGRRARYVALVAAGFDGVGWASPHLDVLAADALCPNHAPWPVGVVEAVAGALRLLASRPDYRDELPAAADADTSPSVSNSLTASVGKSVRRIWRWGGGGGGAASSPPPPDVLPPVVRLLVQDELAPATRGQLAALDPAFGHPVSAPPAAGWPRTLGGSGSAMVGLLPGSASPLTTGGRPSPAATAAPSGGRSGGTPGSWRRLMVRRTVAVATPAMDHRTRRALRYAPTT